MASIRKRNDKWQVQVRRLHGGSVSKTFLRKSDALKWSRDQEIKMERGVFGCLSARKITLRELLERYLREVTPKKRGRARESNRIKHLLKNDISSYFISSLGTKELTSFRDERLLSGVRACQYDLVLISHCINTARIEWGLELDDNPVARIKKPTSPPARERRLNPGEFDQLKSVSFRLKNPFVWPCIELAIETAMRKGELISIKSKDISLKDKTAYLPLTKNGCSRLIPLTPRAIQVIKGLPKGHERLLPLDENTLRLSWDTLKKYSGIEGLRFHDLRHEAITRFFERGLSVAEVALISGHKDPRMLFRYVQLRAEDIAPKLGDWVPCP